VVLFLQNLMKRKRKLKKEKEKENGKEKERETVIFFLIGRKKKPPPRGEAAHSLYLQLPCGLTCAGCIW